jgi:hypothetical protein
MLTVYKSNYCKPCEYLITCFKLCNIDIEILNIKDIDDTIEYSTVPVVKIDDKYILEYKNFSDLINKIRESGIDISISLIYDKLMHIIYGVTSSKSDDFNTFTTIYKIRDIRYHHEKGFLLSHHIITSGNELLIKHIILNYCNELSTYLTKPYIYNNIGFVICQSGKQSILHISAQNNVEIYLKLQSHIKDTCDSIGMYAKDYFEKKNDQLFISRINKIIQTKYQISFDTEKFIKDTLINEELKNIFNQMISKKTKIPPNSMHKSGVIFDKGDIYIKKFIDILNLKYDLQLEDKIFNIYAFTAEYSEDSNNDLEPHKDDSIITINWNLELSDDIDGTNLEMRSKNLLILPAMNQLLIHHGKIEHQVTKRIRGFRKNLIIWLK